MKIKNNFQTKFFVIIFSAIVIVLGGVGAYIGLRMKDFAGDKAKEYTHWVAYENKARAEAFFAEKNSTISTIGGLLSGDLSKLDSATYANYNAMVNSFVLSRTINDPVWILWKTDFIPAVSNKQWQLNTYGMQGTTFNQELGDSLFNHKFQHLMGKTALSASAPFWMNEQLYVTLGMPVRQGGEVRAYVGVDVALSQLTENIQFVIDGGFVTVMANSGMFVSHSNKELLGKTFTENFRPEGDEFHVDDRIRKGETFHTQSKFGGSTYYSYYIPFQPVPNTAPWSVEATASIDYLLNAPRRSMLFTVLWAVGALVLLAFIIVYLMRRFLFPVKSVTEGLQLLATGNIRDVKPIEVNTGDELEVMAHSLNDMVSGLRKTESFALEMGSGNLTYDYTSLGENDQLGAALISMRESLSASKEEQEKRKVEEERLSWTNVGVAKFSDILRTDNNDMKKMGFNLVAELVDYLKVNQGAMFVKADTIEGEEESFDLVTAIAYGRDKYLKKSVKVGDGLVGRCIYERKTIYLTDVPDDYINITSGLGTAPPNCVLIVPCVLNEEVFGVIELASFTPLEEHEVQFVEKIAESVASTISAVSMNERTSRLLEASQHQSEELAAQEEELRQNLEEMEATQEDLKRQMQENNAMRDDLTKRSALLDALLHSLPDYIYFKDLESKFLRISNSMLHIFKAEHVSEVEGKSDFDYQPPHLAKEYYEEEMEIIRSGQGFVDKLQQETLKDGSAIWTSVTKLPLIAEDGTCLGTFGISKNVTDIKQVELEAQKQSTLLNSLLKTLPDYVYFKDKESRFLNISTSMLQIFNANTVDEVLGKSDFDYQPPELAKEYFEDEQRIMESGQGVINKIQKETLRDGTTVWNSTTKLPLMTEDGECMGTFGISKDVSEIKQLEESIERQRVDLLNLLNEIPAEIYLKDDKGVYVFANEARAARHGKTAAEFIGHTDAVYAPQEEVDMTHRDNKELIANDAQIIRDEVGEQGQDVKYVKKPFYISQIDAKGVFGLRVDFDVVKNLK